MWLNKDNQALLKEKNEFVSFRKAFDNGNDINLMKWFIGIGLVLIIFLLLPWTQNIQAPGIITTRSPEQRPQELNSVIDGRIEHWFVKEGDMVVKGDTILKISEVEEYYLDPELLKRTEEQILAKEGTVDFYRNKVTAIQNQLSATYQVRELTLQQLKNKIKQATLNVVTDSMALKAAETELKIAQDQYKRQEELYKQGLKSLTELEQRKQQLQNAEAKITTAANKFANTKNDLLIAKIELNQTDNEYSEKMSKAESDKFAALSEITNGESEVAKLKNQFSNYSIRNAFYYVLAPQNGQITKTISAGIGEIVKAGEMIVKIVPQKFQYAVEMYVRPMDLPLMDIGQKVRFQFDGWPAIVFSGWPVASYGTYGGVVVAIDNSVSDNGKFRILVVEDSKDQKWPDALKVGGGAKGMALLKDVTIIYELWRNINGFPPDFYKSSDSKEQPSKNEK
ncbi:MAG: HlyD family efflux transporter periplasmic adaptor subunit [Saprospiraceae bacterium]|nr:HlyD family efflux transporter periplasmic adaptor subunit [Candidatus Vicinibacter proximus]MBL7822191.1 HlyD family efflux transporter periplasmic adaptor subunit [Saprospiraceae bacterium]MCC6843289.1 HlyD family efflux transporter periplasmic adaptor subunit [Saprospiraceae bacterium]HRG33070.1 HlyD family efflux transporter periplasmic adaptor subunit [Saprospiraceae bacterium]